jgi:hypothetical protein
MRPERVKSNNKQKEFILIMVTLQSTLPLRERGMERELNLGTSLH